MIVFLPIWFYEPTDPSSDPLADPVHHWQIHRQWMIQDLKFETWSADLFRPPYD